MNNKNNININDTTIIYYTKITPFAPGFFYHCQTYNKQWYKLILSNKYIFAIKYCNDINLHYMHQVIIIFNTRCINTAIYIYIWFLRLLIRLILFIYYSWFLRQQKRYRIDWLIHEQIINADMNILIVLMCKIAIVCDINYNGCIELIGKHYVHVW